ncbi:uncharacterized protein B0I36DRAFT_325851 [Microdochium trichocladiopsis]|uniref:Uncharacterized protein n=1 Tax=Microdochium trichocladiopsis TaxID=1682393 RepID=A0A9P8Y7H9_9PEZI|nr:uncharacterized protein B0I36DRAFT_325851 [Microdochium trichocladiopsis]KAH7029482.1 hypothetical protein B0I36DRAFT_325851 [Microdochium trichocladiopsis]
MASAANLDSVVNQGEFKARKPPSKPMTTKGHAPGVKVGKDAVPEFHAQKYPPGTAPPEHTYEPRPNVENMSIQAAALAEDEDVPRVNVEDTLGGATSRDLNKGKGRPVQGESSQELHGNKHVGNQKHRERSGLEGVGASVGVDMASLKGADRPEGVHKGVGPWTEFRDATQLVPEPPETVASEMP